MGGPCEVHEIWFIRFELESTDLGDLGTDGRILLKLKLSLSESGYYTMNCS
jgi:hypothetical protein